MEEINILINTMSIYILKYGWKISCYLMNIYSQEAFTQSILVEIWFNEFHFVIKLGYNIGDRDILNIFL